MARRFFDHEQFNFEFQLALGGVSYGCGDVGEMFATADRIVDGNADSWCREWNATAERLAATAEGCAKSAHQVSARAAYLRAATYFAVALAAVDGTSDPTGLLRRTFAEHRRCFDAYVTLLDPPAERVEIPYEATSLPGYLFRPVTAPTARPTVIINNGSDGAVTTLWPTMSAGGVARGYNVLIFDGPGQQSMLFDRGVPFRYDWEHVIAPVVDFLLARPDVDPARIVLYGISQAGYWVPRALAFEHRIAAAIVDPGVYDAFAPWLNALPVELRTLLDTGDKPGFDRVFDEGMRQAPPAQRQNWAWRAKPYGLTSAFDVFTAARQYNLSEVADRITTPLMIADPEGEQFWPGQSQQLSQHLSGVRELVSFTAAEGADRHCEPMARSLLEQRMFDWLDRTLDDRASSAMSNDRTTLREQELSSLRRNPTAGVAVDGRDLTDDALLSVLDRYLTILQTHPTAEDMMQRILTPDFRTGFIGGFLWQGLDGLRNFLSQRDGFFDERHEIEGLLDRSGQGDQLQAHTRLRFFLRRWQPPSPLSEEFTGRCYHRWEIQRVEGTWRVAAQLVERFTDLDDNARRLFATPDEGLNR